MAERAKVDAVPPYEPEGHPCHKESDFCAGSTVEIKNGDWECIAHLVSWGVGRIIGDEATR